MDLVRLLLIFLPTVLFGCESPTEGTVSGNDAGRSVDHGTPLLDGAAGHPDGASSADARSSGDGALPTSEVCVGHYLPADAQGVPAYPSLVEASGLVASRSRPDLFWLHNDSGDAPVLYAVGSDGRQRGRLTVPTEAIDWEDLATAACPSGGGSCLWIADVGDNQLVRAQSVVYAVREPSTDGDQAAERVWSFPIRYPGGTVNSEALIVAPSGDRFWIFEKVEGEEARIFEHPGPLNDGQLATMQTILSLRAPGVAIEGGRLLTGAALHPSGERVLLRTYTGSFEYRLDAPLAFATMNDSAPMTVAFGPISERQGEAITYDASGQAIWTISEDPDQQAVQPLNFYGCAP